MNKEKEKCFNKLIAIVQKAVMAYHCSPPNMSADLRMAMVELAYAHDAWVDISNQTQPDKPEVCIGCEQSELEAIHIWTEPAKAACARMMNLIRVYLRTKNNDEDIERRLEEERVYMREYIRGGD